MKAYIIKEITINDIESLRPLMECLSFHHNNVSANFKGTYPRHSDDQRIARFKNEVLQEKSKIFGCYVDDKIVGVIKIDLNEPQGVIDYLVVQEEYRGFGFGDALMNMAMLTFKEYGIKDIELHVVYGNDTVNFYERYGFRKQSYIMEYKETDYE